MSDVGAAATGVEGRANPYVGPRPLRAGERLHGRSRILDDLENAVEADRVVLLCAPSGAGKSSLLEAGLRPALEAAGFVVPPTVRVSHELVGAQPTNRYVASVLLSLERGATRSTMSPEALASTTLTEYSLEPLFSGGDELCVFFDQFEEIFTLDPIDVEAKAAFFRQLEMLLRNPRLWAVFSMRDDYIAQLEPYLDCFPRRLATRMRLDFLDVEGAKEAVVEPARALGIAFEPAAVQQLVDDLRTTKVMRGGHEQQLPGPYIEPVQLQVVCRQLFDRLPPGTKVVTEAQVREFAKPTNALAEFYAERVAASARVVDVSERLVREWFEHELITPDGFRSQSNTFPHDDGPRILDRLENAYLVRSESRRGQKWYELTHDRMVAPVLSDNRAWFDRQLAPWQRRATDWERARQPIALLIGGTELAAAERAVAERPADVNAVERAFVEASRAAVDAQQAETERQERERREELDRQIAETRRARRRSLVFAALAVLTVGALVASLVFSRRARQTEQRAAAERRGVLRGDQASLARSTDDPYLSAVLSLGLSATEEPALGADTWDVASAKLAAQPLTRAAAPALVSVGLVVSVDWAADGRRVVAGSADGTLTIVDVTTGTRRELGRLAQGLRQVRWSPDGSTLAVATGGVVTLVEADTGAAIRDLEIGDKWLAMLAWRPDGRTLATIAESAGYTSVVFFDPDSGERRDGGPVVLDRSTQSWELAWAPDGDVLAVAGGTVSLVSYDDRTVGVVELEGATAFALAWTGADHVAVGTLEGGVYDIDATTRQARLVTTLQAGSDRSVAADPGGSTLAVIDGVGTLHLFDGRDPAAPPRDVDQALGWRAVSMALSSEGTIAVGSDDGAVRIVDVATAAPQGAPVPVSNSELTAAEWSPDATSVALQGVDGRPVVRGRAGERVDVAADLLGATVATFQWSPDGARVATTRDSALLVLDGRTFAPIGAESDVLGDVVVDALSWVDDDTIALASFDEIGLVREGNVTKAMSLGDVDTRVRALMPDGRSQLVAALFHDGTVAVADIDREALVTPFRGLGAVRALAWSPGGGQLAAVDVGGQLRLWDGVADRAGDQAVLTVPGATTLTWAGGGTLLVGTGDGRIETTRIVRDGATIGAQRLGTPVVPDGSAIVGLRVVGTEVAIATADAGLFRYRIWRDLTSGSAITGGAASAVGTWSSDGERYAVGRDDGSVTVYADGKVARSVATGGGRVSSLTWTASGVVEVLTTTGEIVALDGDTGERVASAVTLSGGAVTASAWNDAGDTVAVGRSDGTVELVTSTGAPILSVDALRGERVIDVAWFPWDTEVVALGSNGALARIGQKSQEVRRARPVNGGSVVSWSQADNAVVVGGSDGTLTVLSYYGFDLDVLPVTEQKKVQIGAARVVDVAWTSDDATAAILLSDGTVAFRRAGRLAEPVATTSAGPTTAGIVAWAPDDGALLVTAGVGGAPTVLEPWSQREACSYIARVVTQDEVDVDLGPASGLPGVAALCRDDEDAPQGLPVFTESPTA